MLSVKEEEKGDPLTYYGNEEEILQLPHFPASEHRFCSPLSLAYGALTAHSGTEGLGRTQGYPQTRFFQCVCLI